MQIQKYIKTNPVTKILCSYFRISCLDDCYRHCHEEQIQLQPHLTQGVIVAHCCGIFFCVLRVECIDALVLKLVLVLVNIASNSKYVHSGSRGML